MSSQVQPSGEGVQISFNGGPETRLLECPEVPYRFFADPQHALERLQTTPITVTIGQHTFPLFECRLETRVREDGTGSFRVRLPGFQYPMEIYPNGASVPTSLTRAIHLCLGNYP